MDSLDSARGFPNDTFVGYSDTRYCNLIMNDLSPARAPSPHKFSLPEGLRQAWPHLVMFLVLSTAKQHREASYELFKFRDLAYGSRTELMKSLARESLHRQEAVLPFGVTSLLVKNFLQDITLGLPDIASIYSETLEKLVLTP